MGSVGDIIGKLPGLSGKIDESQLDNNVFNKTEAIILSMTKKEREDVGLLNASRKRGSPRAAALQSQTSIHC